ncbi:MAG: hypothetical protein N3D16_03780 [Anaerolineales bacterium]|nr:hypothetical protein [Anaerolineales bacterium]
MKSNPKITLSGMHTYTLTVYGELDGDFIATFCPPRTRPVFTGKTIRLDNLQVDQSGLLGILRSLHNRGCVLLSLSIDPGETP